MKKNIKIISVLIAFVLLFASFTAVSASAAGITYSATSVSGKQGDTVTITVKISSDTKIWAANVMLGYNSSELQYVSSSKGDTASSGSLHNTGSSVNYSGTFSKTSGTVFTVKFKILKSSGTATLKLTSTENIDYNGKSYTCSCSNGTVTVTGSSAMLGDVNNDKKITASDARMVLQHAVGTITLGAAAQADVNKDNKVTATDARIVLQVALGIRDF